MEDESKLYDLTLPSLQSSTFSDGELEHDRVTLSTRSTFCSDEDDGYSSSLLWDLGKIIPQAKTGFQLEASNEVELDMEESLHDRDLVKVDFTRVQKGAHKCTLYLSPVYHGVKDPITTYMDIMFLKISSLQFFKPLKNGVCRSELQINNLFQLINVPHSVLVK